MTVSFFDGHNDMLLRLWHNDDWGATAFLESDGSGHIDRERMATAHMIGGFFAIFIPADKTDMLAAGPVDQKRALIQCLEMIDIFDMLSSTDFAPCLTGRDAGGMPEKISAVLHIEGAEMISDSLDELIFVPAWRAVNRATLVTQQCLWSWRSFLLPRLPRSG